MLFTCENAYISRSLKGLSMEAIRTYFGVGETVSSVSLPSVGACGEYFVSGMTCRFLRFKAIIGKHPQVWQTDKHRFDDNRSGGANAFSICYANQRIRRWGAVKRSTHENAPLLADCHQYLLDFVSSQIAGRG